LLFSIHECLQFLYIRNYKSNEIYRRIPLNYFPICINLSENSEKYIAIGTKEKKILFITRIENSINAGFNLDIFSGHYDVVKSVCFSKDNSKLFSTSYSEVFVWNINN
jgi:WD40 repeat protein